LPTPDERFARLVGEAQRDSRLPSLTAAVFRDGEVAWSQAIGLADVEVGTEASVDTQYAVASITKTFTAISVMQLRDEGKLDLDDPLERHLPDVPHGSLSLGRMLAHASGLQREPPGEVWETLVFPEAEELLARPVLEEKVAAVVKKLKEHGLVSPYLRSFVVARINPLRWIKDEPPPLEDVLKTMRERAAKFNVEKIKPQDLAGAAGPPDEEA